MHGILFYSTNSALSLTYHLVSFTEYKSTRKTNYKKNVRQVPLKINKSLVIITENMIIKYFKVVENMASLFICTNTEKKYKIKLKYSLFTRKVILS